MKICPSTLCGRENPEDREYCINCGVELSLSVDEAKVRDAIFEAFKVAVKENPQLGVTNPSRASFEYALEKSVGQLFKIGFEFGAKKSTEKRELKTEYGALTIEERKLKVLEEINKNLQKIAKKK